MDEFDTDIFTFRQSDGGIVNDVVSKQGFADDALLDAFTEEDIKDILPLILGYQYLCFN